MTLQDPQRPSLVDGFSRRVSYLRLSVTDRCNLRCSYCMPADGSPLMPRSALLSHDELVLLARVALDIGIRKIRITGGEPLLRSDLVAVLNEVGALPGLERLGITTNGYRLPELAVPLKQAGVHAMNISIDSLRPERFTTITRGGRLADCRAGIDAALAAGFRVKLNVVIMAGINSEEILDFVQLIRELPVEVRFIEYMPTRGKHANPLLTVPSDQVLDTIAEEHELQALTAGRHAGPARSFRIADWPGTVGVISPVSHHFCGDCNRIRVTASGLARSCLFHDTGLDLQPWLKKNDTDGLASALRQVVSIKPEAHHLGRLDSSDEQDPGPVCMSQVGG